MSRAGTLRCLILAGSVLVLEAACRWGYIDPTAVIPPSAMAAGAWSVLRDATTRGEILLTLTTVAQAIFLAILGGFALGAVLYRVPRVRAALDPLLASYYAVPTFVFYPVFIVLFGLNRQPLVAIGFVFAVVSVAISTLDGLSRVPSVFNRTAQAMRLTPWQKLRHITLPAAAPWLFTGAKFAVAYAFIGVIAGEFVLSGAGMGHAIAFAYNAFDNRVMYGFMFVLFLIVTLANMGLWTWEQRLYERRGGR